MRRVVILGSTGSIGTQALEILRRDPEAKVTGLAAGSSIEKLREQAEEFLPEAVCVFAEAKAREFAAYGLPVKVYSGMEGLLSIVSMEECDEVLVSVVGMIGIQPTLQAIRAGKGILLANKETLVCAGHLIMPLARERGIEIRPVDSEHSAIWQSLRGEDPAAVEQILLTASGGPFRGKRREELAQVRKEDALRHPNWSMGRKITVDSASMVNKGLEVIEAAWLFSLPVEKIRVLVHPESILHSAVLFRDGSIKGQMGPADMRLPIAYALYAPGRADLAGDRRLDLASIGKLHFEEPDLEVFKGLALGIRAGKRGGSMPTVYNAANEEAVSLFLSDRISFLDIWDSIEAAMDAHEALVIPSPDLPEILRAEAWARAFVRRRLQ